MTDRGCNFCDGDLLCQYVARTSDTKIYTPLDAKDINATVQKCLQGKRTHCPYVNEAAIRMSNILLAG